MPRCVFLISTSISITLSLRFRRIIRAAAVSAGHCVTSEIQDTIFKSSKSQGGTYLEILENCPIFCWDLFFRKAWMFNMFLCSCTLVCRSQLYIFYWSSLLFLRPSNSCPPKRNWAPKNLTTPASTPPPDPPPTFLLFFPRLFIYLPNQISSCQLTSVWEAIFIVFSLQSDGFRSQSV